MVIDQDILDNNVREALFNAFVNGYSMKDMTPGEVAADLAMCDADLENVPVDLLAKSVVRNKRGLTMAHLTEAFELECFDDEVMPSPFHQDRLRIISGAVIAGALFEGGKHARFAHPITPDDDAITIAKAMRKAFDKDRRLMTKAPAQPTGHTWPQHRLNKIAIALSMHDMGMLPKNAALELIRQAIGNEFDPCAEGGIISGSGTKNETYTAAATRGLTNAENRNRRRARYGLPPIGQEPSRQACHSDPDKESQGAQCAACHSPLIRKHWNRDARCYNKACQLLKQPQR